MSRVGYGTDFLQIRLWSPSGSRMAAPAPKKIHEPESFGSDFGSDSALVITPHTDQLHKTADKDNEVIF